ncbi:MAG: UDP-3-O-(3-hydroxymyristoyl)glucosamine N-acyltransferase, partial [Bdellovibrionaceae bacterium]|nr:UDP-3-O-(3-hydroxymyristoyl)glucosamine N-acyltransferase [Pseudobdellovibrionaceae bacterium]
MQPPDSASALTLREVAVLVGGQLEGEDTLPIQGVADLQSATPSDLSFLANPKYAAQARATNAAAVLVGEDFTGALPCARIRVPNPSTAFALVIAHFAP